MSQKLVNNLSNTGTLNVDTLAAATITAGPTLLMYGVAVNSLSAKVVVEAETNTLTLSAIWQVSNDDSTWYSCLPSNGAATVALATGTAGDDAVITTCLAANEAVYGWRYARCSVQNGVATGAATDTYLISYNYARETL